MRGQQQSLALLAPPDEPQRVAGSEPAARLAQSYDAQWICLFFNNLLIEVHNDTDFRPSALLSGDGQRSGIMACNDLARKCGVRPGMGANAALALAPDLELLARDSGRESAVLEQLANRCLRYTPSVCIAAGQTLLLDVGASLKLFGGPAVLTRRILAEFAEHGHSFVLRAAPTASAALWLARAANTQTRNTAQYDEPSAGLRIRLSSLPVSCFGWPERVVDKLAQMGIATFGECVRLPRDGFARRIGADYLRALDRALGLQPEVHAFYQPAEQFRATLDLPAETNVVDLVLAGARRLLQRLALFLQRRQLAVQVLWICLSSRDCAPAWLRIGLLQPATDADYLLELLRLRLADQTFSAPLVAVTIVAQGMPATAPESRGLFARSNGDERPVLNLLEQLTSRLGEEAVHGIRCVADYRPESAWAVHEPAGPAAGCAIAGSDSKRPLWMLPAPRALQSRAGRPVLDGVLEIECGPERIETGWWDGNDIRRDYYVARHRDGAKFWVYEDRRSACWYLHGLFG